VRRVRVTRERLYSEKIKRKCNWNQERGDRTAKYHGKKKGKAEKSRKQSATPILVLWEERNLNLQPQGKPGSPGDNRLAVLATGDTHSSYKP
jgi:hypothetical protein